jgi:hypothetical protein
MAAQLEDDTMKLGLLMEAAQAQQTLAVSTLDQLREHTAGLDAIVREEIRATILEEMQSLADDSRRAAEALRGLQRAANLRLLASGTAMLALSALVPFAISWWWLPSRAEIAALGAARDQLTANIARLAQQGGRVELRHCGAAQRLCVRVDRSAPPYGEAADFRVVKGY